MKLVDNFKEIWKHWSAQVAASQLVLVAFWASLPQEWKDAVPGWVLTIVVGIFALGVLSAKAVKQTKLEKKGEE